MKTTLKGLKGFALVIVDRGFVYVGDVECDGDWCVVSDAENIRRWNTAKGLGQLVLEGPQADTERRKVGTVRVPMHALISLIDIQDRVAWKW